VVLGERGQLNEAQAESAGESADGARPPATGPAAQSGNGASGASHVTPQVKVTGGTAIGDDASVPSQTDDVSKPDAQVTSIARPSAGCGRDPASAGTTVTVNGVSADFLLEVPAPYQRARGYALVLAFRGMDQTAALFRDQLQLAAVTSSAAIIVHVNPLSPDTNWDFQRDMPLVSALITALGNNYCLDLDRVFAVGDKEGAMFVNLVGCVRAPQVRAIALLSSTPPPLGPCRTNLAVWLMQQSDAETMTVGNGLGNRDFWALRNGCDLYSPTLVSPAGCVAYANCGAGLPVRYCEHQGAGLPSFAIGAAWDFFEML
ncbi:MAG TPA: hypothetical protein VFN67_28435, partial [Polyangiales bacterium]|nr:hypothetical protein [Polyangiales bacterium]